MSSPPCHRKTIAGVVMLFLPLLVSAQVPRGLGFTLSQHTGGIIKHTEKLTFTPPDYSAGAELSLTYRTHGRKDWEAWRGYPILGVAGHVFSLGSSELGRSIGGYPFVDIPLWRRQKGALFFQVGSGLAWLSARHDRVNNPGHNAIGSHVNNVTALRIHGDWQLAPQWVLTAGWSFTHYSNGQARIPNYGINIMGGMVGVQWTPAPLGPEDYRAAETDARPTRRWGWVGHAGAGMKEYFAIGGPQYPVYLGSAGVTYALTRINRLVAGLEYEYNAGVATFSKLSWQYDSGRERFWAASRIMVYGGEEFRFGPWALQLQAGTYLGRFSLLVPFPVYTRLAMRYYFPPARHLDGRMFAGVYLKSHMVTAEYIAFGLGMAVD